MSAIVALQYGVWPQRARGKESLSEALKEIRSAESSDSGADCSIPTGELA